MKQLYFQDELEVWFQDADGRFWHLDLATNTLTELIPRDADAEEPIPPEVWPALGTLLGILILRREKTVRQHDIPLVHGGGEAVPSWFSSPSANKPSKEKSNA